MKASTTTSVIITLVLALLSSTNAVERTTQGQLRGSTKANDSHLTRQLGQYKSGDHLADRLYQFDPKFGR